ncbi:hypothetical protein [uncultured Desulfovibrio sp.]|uniref:hypothetical protein n=1 Tax=uncultured Desulfovibrio sp. TaxID=167968 RepID=UPI002608472C|nr:hypothetical protein [uncultured Desulfovibrio sp.]
MKKIAVIGTSNSIIKDGYGQFLLELLPGQVDIYGLGACSSINAVFLLLSREVIDKYEYVLFDFCINDYSYWRQKRLSKYLILAYWAFIFERLRKSRTVPIFLLLTVSSGNRKMVDFYINMARLFDAAYIDISRRFSGIPREELFRDHAHYSRGFQQKIAHAILETVAGPKRTIRSLPFSDDIGFYLSDKQLCDNRKRIATSLMEMECYAIDTRQDNIVFPQDAGYISGILFWSDGPEGGVYDLLDIHDATNRVQEDLNLEYRGFFVRELAASLPEGLKAPVISFQQAATSHVDSIPLKRNPLFYVNSFLFCTVPPVAWGKAFYQRHKAVLKESFRQRVQYGVFLLRMLAQKAASAVTRMRQACGKLSSRKNA